MSKRVNRGKGSSSVTARKLQKALPGLGFTFVRQARRRELWQHGETVIAVPNDGDVSRLTVRQIAHALGVSTRDIERRCG